MRGEWRMLENSAGVKDETISVELGSGCVVFWTYYSFM
jgi:hypothetical protein